MFKMWDKYDFCSVTAYVSLLFTTLDSVETWENPGSYFLEQFHWLTPDHSDF